MIFEINHRTFYRYSQPVTQSQHLVHMVPRACREQTTLHHSLMIDPAPASRYDGVDAFGNHVVILDLESPHKEFILHARSSIDRRSPAPVTLDRTAAWDALDDFIYSAARTVDLDAAQFRCASKLTSASIEIADYAKVSFPKGRPVLEAAFDLTQRVFGDFRFDASSTDVSTPISQVFRQRRGVCQDFAHLALACLRALRVPARYVSGYILTRPPPGQAKLQGTDASHAWISVWAPDVGWRDFDPTNGLMVSDEHIVIAYGRDYNDVSPISGVLLGGGEHSVAVAVDVDARDGT
jgi:transglutaminase-like putative cysteine protease